MTKNSNSVANYIALAQRALADTFRIEQRTVSNVQTIAYAIMCERQERIETGVEVATLTAINTSGEARKNDLAHVIKCLIDDRPKAERGVKSASFNDLIRRWDANRATIVRAYDIAMILLANGVTRSMFSDKSGLFEIPVSLLLAPKHEVMDRKLSVEGATIPLNGRSFYVSPENSDKMVACYASTEQLVRATVARNPSQQTSRSNRKATPNNPSSPPAAPSGDTGKDQPSVTHTLGFNALVSELDKTIQAWKNDAKQPMPMLTDFDLSTRNAMARFAAFYNAMVKADEAKDAPDSKPAKVAKAEKAEKAAA